MIMEALKYLIEQGKKLQEVRTHALPGDPPSIVRWVEGGTLHTAPAIHPDFRARLATIADLVAFEQDRWKMTEGDEPHTYWVSPLAVFLRLTTWEQAVVYPEPTDEWKFLADQRDNPLIAIADLRDFLRDFFRESHPDIDTLINQIKSIDIRNTTSAGATIDRGRESMGRQIEEACAPHMNLPPEIVTFSVRRFRNPDMPARFPVRVSIDPDTKTLSWRFKPNHQDMIDANEAAIDCLVAQIEHLQEPRDHHAPVYRGIVGRAV